MKRIAIDMDEVMADTIAKYLELYNADFQLNVTKQDLHGRRVFEVTQPAHLPTVREYFQRESFFAELPVMPDSQEVIRELMNHYEVFITTAAMEVPNSFTAKYNWLQRHFPFLPTSHIVFCGDKAIIAADYLIDDNVRQFERFRGEGILFTAPHNVHETRYRRVDNWQDVRAMFVAAQTLRS